MQKPIAEMTGDEEMRATRRLCLPGMSMGVALLVWTTSCARLVEPTIDLVIPNDFSGPVLMIEDPQGMAVAESGSTYRVVLPKCGVVYVRSAGFLRESATWKVRRVNGESVPIDSQATDIQLAFRFGGWRSWQHSSGRLEHFVGTAQQFESFDFSSFPTPSCDK